MIGGKWIWSLGAVLAALMIPLSGHAQHSKPTLILNVSEAKGLMEPSSTNPGVWVELAKRAAELAGFNIQTKFYPWPRAMKNTRELGNNIVVGLSRTPPRENKYTWITPFMDLKVAFTSTASKYDSFDQAKIAGSVGTWKGSSYHKELIDKGFKNLRLFSTDKSTDRAITLLERGRLDVWYGGINSLKIRWQHFAKDKNLKLYFGKAIYTDTVWMAGGTNFSKVVAGKLKQALAKMRANGDYRSIEIKYFGQN